MSETYELESSLEKLLSTLKANRDHVPREVLKSYYKQPYEALLHQINVTATAFAKKVLTENLSLNPDVPIEDQVAVINKTIADSGILKEMGACLSKEYSVEKLHRQALALREKIELALWPYINLQTCLVADLFDIEKEPVIYNPLTKQVYENDGWKDRELDLCGKLLVRFPSDYREISTQENENGEYTYENRTVGNTYASVL